ncbi:MAG: hypothetical protein FVQ78_10670, partial [Solirubrobacterales bacterium]|nr:hypothetical protein [Solirubrobacterales bacterium]
MTQLIVIYPEISADFTALPDTEGCHPFLVTLAELTSGADSLYWDFGDGSFIIDTVVDQIHLFINDTFNLDTIYNVELIAISQYGCPSDTIRQDILVHPKPTACFALDTTEGCTPLTVNIDLSCAAGYDSLFWDFGDGETDDGVKLSHNYDNTTDSTVCYIMQMIAQTQYGCADTIRDTICVHPEIDVKFAIVPDTVGCQAYPAQLFNLSTGADTFYWDLGDNTFIVTDQDTTINHIWTNLNVVPPDSVYNITLVGISSFGCRSDTTSDGIRVHPKPAANFTVDVDTGCSCFTVTITNLASGFDSLFWDFGDGSPPSTDTSSSLVHTYCNITDSTVNYILKLIAVTQYGCADTLTDTIKVHPEVTANFTVFDSIGCDPFAVCFFNLSLGEDSYDWDFGDGDSSIIENPCHTFTNTSDTLDSTYVVELIVSSVFGCGSDTARDTIIVHPTPTAGFTVDTNEGISPVVITITGLSTWADSVYWDFGDQTDTTTVSPAAPFTHTYTNTTGSIIDYPLCAIAQTNLGCTDTFCLPIKVHPEIDANFAIVPNDSGCHPFTIDLINLSLRADTFYWNFGDLSPIFVTTDKNTVITHTYYNSSAINDTTYCITLTAVSDSGARDTMTQCIVVHPKPLANFSVDINAGCSPLTITIFNTSTPFGSLNYFWVFSDSLLPNTTSSASFTHSYVNTSSIPISYTITLLVNNSNGCTDTLIDTITVYPEITAQFGIVPDTGCSPLDVQFFNNTIPPDLSNYNWDFGDSLFSTDTNPTHPYLNPSLFDTTYYPCLIATTAFGCKDSICDSV